MKYFKIVSIIVVIFSACVLYSMEKVVNTCGNIQSDLEPQLAQECTGVTYKNGTCCFVQNMKKDIRYCVLLLGSLKEEAIRNFYNDFNINYVTVNCNSNYLSFSAILIMIFGLLL